MRAWRNSRERRDPQGTIISSSKIFAHARFFHNGENREELVVKESVCLQTIKNTGQNMYSALVYNYQCGWFPFLGEESKVNLSSI